MKTESNIGIVRDIKWMLSGVVFLCRALAFSVEAFLHTGFGGKYIRTQAASVPALLLAYSLCWTGRNLVPLFALLAAYLAACVAAMASQRNPKPSGNLTPDFYSGRPRGMRSFGFLRESTVKRFVEPVQVLLIGLAGTVFDQPLGVFLLIASLALFVSVNVDRGFAASRTLESQDQSKRTTPPLLVQVRRVPPSHVEVGRV